MTEEPTIYQDHNVTITRSRVTFPDKTYALANVTSVGVSKKEASQTGPICCIAGGAIGVLIGAMIWKSGGPTCVGIGIVFILLGILAGRAETKNAEYTVVFGSASGETKAMSAKDEDYITKIANAINEAIIQRG